MRDFRKLVNLVLTVFFVFSVTACNPPAPTTESPTAENAATETALVQTAETEMVSITINVKVPENTPAEDSIMLWKGIFFPGYQEELTLTSAGNNIYTTTFEAPQGSILCYRYGRNGDWGKGESYVFRDGQYRTRELLVQKDLVINETIAKWQDLPLLPGATGTLSGTVTTADGQPVMGMIVSAGPFQTHSAWDGTYTIFGVPAGEDAVTIRADNGEYVAQVNQVTIPGDGIATLDFSVSPATMTTITFNVKVPDDTPPDADARLFGDTYHLGLFPTFEGSGISTSNMISMTRAGDGIWTFTTTLGEGTTFQYMYTLGDAQVNQEHDLIGNNVVRTYTASGNELTINDTVATWKSFYQVALTLDVQSPTADTVYVTGEGWGGNEPIKMWSQGDNKWTYIWYVNPLQTLKYRYSRNGDSQIGHETLVPDDNATFREIPISTADIAVSDTITSWRNQLRETLPDPVVLNYSGPIPDRISGQPFQRGIELIDYWRSAWEPLVEPTITKVVDDNAQWVQIASVWSIVSIDPPIVEPTTNSFLTEELVSQIRAIHERGLKVAIRAQAYPESFAIAEVFNQTNSIEWYDAFFEQVEKTMMYNTVIAKQENVEMIIFSNFGWLDDNDPVKAAYINQKWEAIVAAVRAEYPSVLLTNDTYTDRPEYDWFGDLDYIGDIWWWPLATTPANTNFDDMKDQALQILQNTYLPRYQKFNKPLLFLEIAYYSADGTATQQFDVFASELSEFIPETPSIISDWDEQADAYEAVLWAFAETPWVQGAYPFGYSYSDLDSKNYSIRSKTAEEVLKQIYGLFPDN